MTKKDMQIYKKALDSKRRAMRDPIEEAKL